MKPMFFLSHILLLVIKYKLILSTVVEIRHFFCKFLYTVYVAYVISVYAVCMCLCVFCDVCAVYAMQYMLVCCVLMCVSVWYLCIHCILRLCAGACMWAVCAMHELCLYFPLDISWEHKTWVCKHNCLWSRKRIKIFTVASIDFFCEKIQREIIIIKLDIY